jgi:hypothetical protein
MSKYVKFVRYDITHSVTMLVIIKTGSVSYTIYKHDLLPCKISHAHMPSSGAWGSVVVKALCY